MTSAGWSIAACLVVGAVLTGVSSQAFLAVCGDALRTPRGLLEAKPDRYILPKSASYSVSSEGGNYAVDYKFRAVGNDEVTLKFSLPKSTVDERIGKFGFDKAVMGPMSATPENIRKRQAAVEAGYFRIDGDQIKPAFRRMIRDERDILTPIVTLGNREMGSKTTIRDRAAFWLAFCQSIPYGIPPYQDEARMYGGLMPPTGTLRMGWGDCDCKGTLFATLMSHYDGAKVIAVNVPGHFLIGVKGVGQPGDDTVEFEGEEYVLCEPVGVARFPFGKKSQLSQNILSMRRIVPYTD
ncbi:MAG: hypothetical protein SFX74_10525 [Fimbriimonadaceae bacterium]|nr:hypothetical protein [Fimbriimonadaceae bacterium]